VTAAGYAAVKISELKLSFGLSWDPKSFQTLFGISIHKLIAFFGED